MVKKILISLDLKIFDRLDKAAEDLGFNRMQTIRYIIKKFLDENKY